MQTTLEKFFEVAVHEGDNNVEHVIIEGPGSICDVQQLRSFFSDCLSFALTSTSWYVRRKAQDEARARRRLKTETTVLLGGSRPKPTRRAST